MSTSIFMVINKDPDNYTPFGLYSTRELAERSIRAFSQGEIDCDFGIEELVLDQHKKEINLKMLPYAVSIKGSGELIKVALESNPMHFDHVRANQEAYNDDKDLFFTCVWGYSENHAIKEARKILFNTIY